MLNFGRRQHRGWVRRFATQQLQRPTRYQGVEGGARRCAEGVPRRRTHHAEPDRAAKPDPGVRRRLACRFARDFTRRTWGRHDQDIRQMRINFTAFEFCRTWMTRRISVMATPNVPIAYPRHGVMRGNHRLTFAR